MAKNNKPTATQIPTMVKTLEFDVPKSLAGAAFTSEVVGWMSEVEVRVDEDDNVMPETVVDVVDNDVLALS